MKNAKAEMESLEQSVQLLGLLWQRMPSDDDVAMRKLFEKTMRRIKC